MISGAGSTAASPRGGRYDPVTDVWTPWPSAVATGRPYGRDLVWSGTEMIVWGGDAGGTYSPIRRSVQPRDGRLAAQTGEPACRRKERTLAVWTGTEMIILGGHILTSIHQWAAAHDPWNRLLDPARLDTSTEGSRFRGRVLDRHRDVMLHIRGGYGYSGYVNAGARYNPATDTWTGALGSGLSAGCPVSVRRGLDRHRNNSVGWKGEAAMDSGPKSSVQVRSRVQHIDPHTRQRHDPEPAVVHGSRLDRKRDDRFWRGTAVPNT